MRKLAVVIGLILAPLTAHAQGFVELSIGQAKTDIGGLPGWSTDGSDSTWAIGGGFMFSPNVGLEAGYRSLGELSARSVSGGNLLSVVADVGGFYGGVLGKLPVTERLSLAGRVGLLAWEADGTGSVNGVPVVREELDGTDLYFGVGAAYAVNRSFELGVGWTRFDVDGDDADTLELKLRFSF